MIERDCPPMYRALLGDFLEILLWDDFFAREQSFKRASLEFSKYYMEKDEKSMRFIVAFKENDIKKRLLKLLMKYSQSYGLIIDKELITKILNKNARSFAIGFDLSETPRKSRVKVYSFFENSIFAINEPSVYSVLKGKLPDTTLKQSLQKISCAGIGVDMFFEKQPVLKLYQKLGMMEKDSTFKDDFSLLPEHIKATFNKLQKITKADPINAFLVYAVKEKLIPYAAEIRVDVHPKEELLMNINKEFVKEDISPIEADEVGNHIRWFGTHVIEDKEPVYALYHYFT